MTNNYVIENLMKNMKKIMKKIMKQIMANNETNNEKNNELKVVRYPLFFIICHYSRKKNEK
jgi:hypothetical protein